MKLGGDEPLVCHVFRVVTVRSPGDGCHGTMRPEIRLTMSAGMLTWFGSARGEAHQLPSYIGVADQAGDHVLIGSASEVGLTQVAKRIMIIGCRH
jgi:hypothetical protein